MSSQTGRPRGHPANIFINYRREGSSGHSGRLFDALRGHFAGRLFMDIDTLEPGVDFVEAIEQAVGSCEVLIVVIGREWLTIKDAAGQRRLDDPADFVRLEVEAALGRKVRVIPVLVQDATMPRAEELPPSLALLARRNAIELSDARWAYDVDRLARTIQGILKEKEASALALAAALERAAAPPAPAAPVVAKKAVALPAPVVPKVAAEAAAPPVRVVPATGAKAAGSPVRLLALAALVLVAAAGLASVLWMRRTPSGETLLSSRSDSSGKSSGADSHQGTAGPIARAGPGAGAAGNLKPAPPQTPVSRQTPLPQQTASLPQQTAIPRPVPTPPSPLSTPPAREVVIPVPLAREGRGHQEKEGPMKEGDLILYGPGVEEMQLIAAPPPTYPPSLAGNGRYAKVVLQVLVNENGAVGDARVESLSVDDAGADADLREFRKAALAAARQARFEPATKNGIAGKMWGELSWEFGTKK